MKRLQASVLAALTLLTLALSCASSGATPREAAPRARIESTAPFLWTIESGNGAVVHVYGTIHVADDRLYPLPEPAMAAFDDASGLVGEISSDEHEGLAAILGGVIARALLPAGASYESLLGEDELGILKERSGSRYASYSRLMPWVVELAMIGSATGALDPMAGIDLYLYARAREAGRGVRGLETAREQIVALSGGSLAFQAGSLGLTLASIADGSLASDTSELYEAYLAGDEEGVAAMLAAANEEILAVVPDAKAYMERIWLDRNRAWAGTIARLIGEGGTWFVFAGCGHFLGEGSVFDELGKMGVLE